MTGLENALTIPDMGICLALSEVYDQIVFGPRLLSQTDDEED